MVGRLLWLGGDEKSGHESLTVANTLEPMRYWAPVKTTFPPAWTETQVASSAWMFKIVDLSLGKHRLVLRDKIMGEWVKTVFHITVV